MENIAVTYETTDRLLADVRVWGDNTLATLSRGLFGKRKWNGFIQSLDALRNADGKIPLPFEVIYGHAFRPMPHTTSTAESIVRLHPKP